MVFASVLTSCDMNTINYGEVGLEQAITDKNDAQAFLNGIYANLRGATAGNYIAIADIQMDYFVATQDFGNRLGSFSTGIIYTSDQDLESFYSAMYSCIGSTNFFIPAAEALRDAAEDSQKAEFDYMIGQAKFARAYFYYWLMDHFCPTPSAANLKTEARGLQMVEVYAPSSDRSTYPGRSTLAQTTDFIKADLEDAYTKIKAWEDAGHMQYTDPGACYISSYAVDALQARLALVMGDYKTAIDKSEEVINCGFFELAKYDNYAEMWTDDSSPELIFVPFGNQAESSAVTATGAIWVASAQANTSDYIPTVNTLMAYADDDIRFDNFFSVYRMTIQGATGSAYAFTKYPGNPALWTTTNNNLKNKPKPFRLAELYLICAEAYAADGAQKDESKANEYLNELRHNRTMFEDQDAYDEWDGALNQSGSNLVNAIREERAKELIGEGFRMSDLRRWGLGFNRIAGFASAGMAAADFFLQTNTDNITYSANDYRYVWPIPQGEFDVNPNIAGQQNPGY